MGHGRWDRVARGALGLILGVALTLSQANAQSLIRDAEVEDTLQRLSEPVFRGGATSPESIDLYILGDRRLNAFVAGGRNIFLNTGLLMRLTTAEQIQAVIAHELGHINGGHLARRGIQAQKATGAMAVGLLLAIAAGVAGSADAAAAVLTGSMSAFQRSALTFSRGEEASADQAGLTYMERGGINPKGMVEVLTIFRGQEVLSAGSIDPYAQTHPMSVDRLLLAEKRINASPNKAATTDPDLAYRVERMRAKLEGFLDRPEKVLRAAAKSEGEFALIRRAVGYHRLPDPTRALEAVAALVKLRPKDPYYLELQAQILLESNRVAESVPFYRRAVALAPNEPLIRASLARALVALNRPELDREAVTLLERATREDPGNVGAFRDLAIAEARSGNEGKAALATAERFALQTAFKDVTRHARHAAALLPEGSPGWLKAQDLILIGERMTAKDKE